MSGMERYSVRKSSADRRASAFRASYSSAVRGRRSEGSRMSLSASWTLRGLAASCVMTPTAGTGGRPSQRR